MSMLSSWFHKASAFVSNSIQNASADQHTTLTAAADQFSAAAQAADAAIPILAKVVADAALASIGAGQYVPAFNEFLDVLAAEILSRKTAPKAVVSQ